jgi:hypothetical protein
VLCSAVEDRSLRHQLVVTIELARPMEQLLVIHDLPRGGERLACGTRVDVTRLVEREVMSAQ